MRWKDIDVDRCQIFINQGKGNADRHVQLPKEYQNLFRRLQSNRQHPYLFPSESLSHKGSDRYLSPRTVQRLVRKACLVAGITKHITPHSLRHAFATHSFENGCDIRCIQKVLGHARLETTTIYITVATERTNLASPLDQLTPGQTPASMRPNVGANDNAAQAPNDPVGTMRIHHRLHPDDTADMPASQRRHQITIELKGANFRELLTGTIALAQRPGYMRIDFPPMEQWQSVVSRLPMHVATRIESPEFYQTLQHQITRRVATAPPP